VSIFTTRASIATMRASSFTTSGSAAQNIRITDSDHVVFCRKGVLVKAVRPELAIDAEGERQASKRRAAPQASSNVECQMLNVAC
jgi:hypothetical protein